MQNWTDVYFYIDWTFNLCLPLKIYVFIPQEQKQQNWWQKKCYQCGVS